MTLHTDWWCNHLATPSMLSGQWNWNCGNLEYFKNNRAVSTCIMAITTFSATNSSDGKRSLLSPFVFICKFFQSPSSFWRFRTSWVFQFFTTLWLQSTNFWNEGKWEDGVSAIIFMLLSLLIMYTACLDFEVVPVFVEIPDLTIITVWKPVSDDPLVSAAVAPTFRHDSGDQCWRTHVYLKPLIDCKSATQHTFTDDCQRQLQMTNTDKNNNNEWQRSIKRYKTIVFIWKEKVQDNWCFIPIINYVKPGPWTYSWGCVTKRCNHNENKRTDPPMSKALLYKYVNCACSNACLLTYLLTNLWDYQYHLI